MRTSRETRLIKYGITAAPIQQRTRSNQVAISPGSDRIDHKFILRSILDLQRNTTVWFIDFRGGFDSVYHAGRRKVIFTGGQLVICIKSYSA